MEDWSHNHEKRKRTLSGLRTTSLRLDGLLMLDIFDEGRDKTICSETGVVDCDSIARLYLALTPYHPVNASLMYPSHTE